jgi:hypothetical protein
MTAFASYERRHKETRWTKTPRYRDRIKAPLCPNFSARFVISMEIRHGGQARDSHG